MRTRPRVIVAMSGGVDSAVAAGLLAREDYDVVGITMRLWTKEDPAALRQQRRCCSVEDTDDARAAADVLGIPHYVLNLEREFGERVVDYFVDEYARGRTPNPCLACNQHVKFDALLARADALEADFLATGHYARIERSAGRYHLLRAVDAEKDQSYVLYTLGQRELARTLFPIGSLTKAEVRAIARELGLPVAAKPDSADICFVPDGDYRSFLAARLDQRPGPIVDETGATVGTHGGIAAYTVGQRKGLGVALGAPRYVTAVDAGRNVVVIGPEAGLLATRALVEDVRWVSGAPPAGPAAMDVKIRYRTAPARAVVTPSEGGADVRFERPQRAVTPGQAAVFYVGAEVIGGGVIARAVRP